jgi:hypothetical protein
VVEPELRTRTAADVVRSAGHTGLRLGLASFAQDSARIATEILYPVP